MTKQLFTAFLQQTKDDLNKKLIVAFNNPKEYPILFFAALLKKMREERNVIQTIDCSETERSTVVAMLETSFLGSKNIYWLKNISELPKKEYEFWSMYLSCYKGPHSIWFFSHEEIDVTKNGIVVCMPGTLEHDEGMALSIFLGYPSSMHTQQFVARLFAHQAKLSIDTLCALLAYMPLVGSQAHFFFSTLLERLVPSDTSLFSLSTALLAKDMRTFYQVWHEVSHCYSEQFWCSYFSELFWRAAMYVQYSHRGNMVIARSIAYRLPFAFIKSGWRKHTIVDLKKAHQYIYSIDYKFKNAMGYGALDTFFIQFFKE